MCPIEMSGFDEFQRYLQEIQDALAGLDGAIAQIRFNPSDPASIALAITQMESAVDARVETQKTNPTVQQIVTEVKQQYAQGIRERADQALRERPDSDESDETVASANEGQTVNAVTPKAFLSHSSSDKEKIVRPLDELLRIEEGIETWLDERDMPAGADIVDAIFTQGLGGADAVIVVLTPNSIGSRWVHEELSVAVVRKIKKRVKTIIPVISDVTDDDLPDALAATNWIRLKDTSAEELTACAKRIGAALHGLMPALVAPPPQYAGIPVHRLGSLTANDERLLAESCREYVERPNYYPLIDVGSVVAYGASIGMPDGSVVEALQALEQTYYIKELQYYLGSGEMPSHFQITEFGLETYLTSYDAERYRGWKASVLSEIINRGAHDLMTIISSTGAPETVVRHLVHQLESGGHAIVSWHSGGASIMPKPTLRRLLEE